MDAHFFWVVVRHERSPYRRDRRDGRHSGIAPMRCIPPVRKLTVIRCLVRISATSSSSDVLQLERTKLVKCKVKPLPHKLAQIGKRTRRTVGLKSGHIHYVAVDIRAIWNYLAYIDPDPKADCLIGGLITIVGWHLLLHLHGTAHCPANAVEHDE